MIEFINLAATGVLIGGDPDPTRNEFPRATSNHCGHLSWGRASVLIHKLLSRLKSGSVLLADRGYDADWIRELVNRRGGPTPIGAGVSLATFAKSRC